MRGTRYGDFSRSTFQPHRFDGLLLQQGRVQLDSDANEAAAIAQARSEQAIADLMGGSAAPASAPGFEILPLLALSFDGDGAAEVDDAALLLSEAGWAFTVELWVRWDAAAPGTLVDGGAWRLATDGDGELAFTLIGDDASVAVRVPGALEPGRLTHIAAVAAPDFAALYVDAREAGRTATGPGDGRRAARARRRAGRRRAPRGRLPRRPARRPALGGSPHARADRRRTARRGSRRP